MVIPPETKFFSRFYGRSRRCQNLHLGLINADLGIDLPIPTSRIRGASEARAIYEEMSRQYLERLGRAHVAYFGDKSPKHTGHLARIRELFPEAKLIFLYRDGRDVASSLSRMPWIDCNVYVAFTIWLHHCAILQRSSAEMEEGDWPVFAAGERGFSQVCRNAFNAHLPVAL